MMVSILNSNVIIVLQLVLCLLLIISALFVPLSKNPIEAVLYLILVFLVSSILLMLLYSEFFGIVSIIIYVGAIAVLFLFVIMMLNIKTNKDLYKNSILDNKVFLISFGAIGLHILVSFIRFNTAEIFSKEILGHKKQFLIIDQLDNLNVVGQVLYNYFPEIFIISGLVLLVALIGSICLTLNYNVIKKTQLSNKQLSRSSNFLLFYEKIRKSRNEV